MRNRRLDEFKWGRASAYVNYNDHAVDALQHEIDCMESGVKSINEMAEEMWK